MTLCCVSLSPATETVTLQLKWKHQFQFAGYYAAIKKGYYLEEGLDVILKEGTPGGNEVEDVVRGRANFAVGMSDILLSRFLGEPVVLLANIFQHSPVTLITTKISGDSSPQDLFEKSIQMVSSVKSAELQAMFLNEGVTLADLNISTPRWNLEDLTSGRVDAISAYISSQPYLLKKQGIAYTLISPITYGIDFYGDNLFTSEREVAEHPDRVAAFLRASLKGWQYAMENPEEIVEFILSEYVDGSNRALDRDFLLNEAAAYQDLILPQFITIGHTNPGRWKHIADTYVRLGLADKEYSLDGFFFSPEGVSFSWSYWPIQLALLIFSIGIAITSILLLFNRRLKREILAHLQTEKELQESEGKFRALFEQSGGYCMILDPNTPDGIPIILDANKAACVEHGYDREEFIGRPVGVVDDESGKQLIIERTAEIMTGKPFYVENEHIRKDGTIFSVAVNAQRIDIGGKPPFILTTEYDISDQKRLEEKLRQAQKMESIGTLAGGIAHDFNNILSSVLGFTELALDSVEKESAIEEDLQEVYSAGLRAKELVKQILTFARKSGEDVKPIEIGSIVEEVLKFIRSTIPTTIEIKQSVESTSHIMGNATQIHQIIMNLCNNAAQVMEEDGGVVEVSLKDVTFDTVRSSRGGSIKPGDYVELKVSDTGQGIEPHIMTKIFEPYFTTKKVGEGTGMGLAMVHGIVETYKGKVLVESTPGKGTVFTVYLPICREKKIELVSHAEKLPLGHERILLVDDEISITRVNSRILGQLGYEVTAKNSSVEALELFQLNPNEFDLIISDVTMPHMTGDRLAYEVMQIKPDIPVILCSGYNNKISNSSVEEIGVKAFVTKPVVKADLAKIVRAVLDQV